MEALHRLAVVAALAVGCSDSNGTGPCGSGGTPSAVNVCDNFFAPSSSPVGTGAAVAWTWRGANSHNVTFEDGQGSSTTQTSGTHSRTFSATGTFRYRCTIHSSGFDGGPGQMVGAVTVQ